MNRKLILLLATIVLSSLCAASISAQQGRRDGTTPARPSDSPQQPAQSEPPQITAETADVAITATVTAKELLFEVVPNPVVEFPGKTQSDTIWDGERDNLPRPVEPGVTYRNIGIRLKIVSRLKDIDRIVAEALGEVPITDEVLPPQNAPPQPGTRPQTLPSPPNGGSPR